MSGQQPQQPTGQVFTSFSELAQSRTEPSSSAPKSLIEQQLLQKQQQQQQQPLVPQNASYPTEFNPFADNFNSTPKPQPSLKDSDAERVPSDDSDSEVPEEEIRNFHFRTSKDDLASKPVDKPHRHRSPKELIKEKFHLEPTYTPETSPYSSAESSPAPQVHTQTHTHYKKRKHKKHKDYFNWHPHHDVPKKAMKRLIQVNCLVKGDYEDPFSVRWMVAVDKTPASLRAFETVLKLADPKHHIFVVNAREISEADPTNLREAYNRWCASVIILRDYKEKLDETKRPYTILAPVHHDVRRVVVQLAKKLAVQTLAIGKHSLEDKATRVKNVHFRSFSQYVSKHLKHTHTMIV